MVFSCKDIFKLTLTIWKLYEILRLKLFFLFFEHPFTSDENNNVALLLSTCFANQ